MGFQSHRKIIVWTTVVKAWRKTLIRRWKFWVPKPEDQNWILEREDDVWDRKAGTSYSGDETLPSAHSWSKQAGADGQDLAGIEPTQETLCYTTSRRQTSWLFQYKHDRGVDWGLPRNNSSLVVSARLEPTTSRIQVQDLNQSNTLPLQRKTWNRTEAATTWRTILKLQKPLSGCFQISQGKPIARYTE